MRKLIIIPAYNEGMNIEATVKDIQENKNYVLDTRHFPTRSIEEPDTEKTVRGSKDGFNENLLNCA